MTDSWHDTPGDAPEDAPEEPVLLITATALPLERRRLPDDPELAEGAIVGTFLEGRLIARSVQDAAWASEAEGGLFEEPRQLVYVGREVDGRTVRAELCALIPAAELPREPWEAEPEHDALLLLGIVVRLAGDRRHDDLPSECLDHFETLVGAGGEPVADRILRSL